MKVLFTDSLPLIKFIISQPNNVINKSLPNNKLGSVYKALFNCEFPAHDALEYVKALRRILFSLPLETGSEIIVNRGKTYLPNEALEASTTEQHPERRPRVEETYSGNSIFQMVH